MWRLVVESVEDIWPIERRCTHLHPLGAGLASNDAPGENIAVV